MRNPLKYTLLIIAFWAQELAGQVAPPDLRCLQVKPNGDVQLTWIPSPANPAFAAYEVYTAVQKNGPYSLVTSGIAPINTTTYLHAPSTASAQTVFYYMRSAYASGFSANSDTLRTIFLNIVNGNVALNMTFNNLHQPPLVTTKTTFTLTKEYPIGTTGTLAVTSSTVYADTINVCRAKINYCTFLKDNSGCVSNSNFIFGDYNDTKTPDTTYVDSISVLPNGNTVLTWFTPRFDPDVDTFLIIQNLNPDSANSPNTYIDKVSGHTSRSYTLSNTIANSRPVGVYVAAKDSCSQLGNFDKRPVTIYLQTVYDRCAYETKLTWSAYRGMRNGIKEYWVYYSVDGSNFVKIATTTNLSYNHRNVDAGKNLCYFIRVVNGDASITASSNRSCFFSTLSSVPSFLYIRTATIAGNHSALVSVHVDPSKPSSGLEIERSEDGLQFTSAGVLPYNGTSQYSFVDENADPTSRSYYYRAILKDSCGNSRNMSNVSRTIFLKVSADKERIFTMHLSWNGYEGFGGGVNGYNIFRVVNDGAHHLLTTVLPQANSYTDNIEDEAPNGSKVGYLVQAIEGNGNPFGIFEHSNSNTVQVYLEGRLFVPTAFAPGGVNKTWRPITHFIDKSDYRVIVYNRWGKKVFETRDDKEEWTGENCTPDVYVYQVSYKNSRGEYKQEHGTVMILE